MKLLKFFIIAQLLLIISACNTPNILISDDLKANSSVLEVKGRQGWQYNQVIRYGEFSTSKIKRGWTTGYDMDFVIRFQKAQEKLSFIQFSPDQKQAEVLAVSKFKNTELDLLDGYMSFPIKYENSFTGTIINAETPNNSWEFIIHDPDGSLANIDDCGMAKDKSGNEIHIHAVKKLEGKNNWIQLGNFGYEFIYCGTSVGAVSTVNNGKVWIKKDICPDIKLVISCISTSLLVRHDMEDSMSTSNTIKEDTEIALKVPNDFFLHYYSY